MHARMSIRTLERPVSCMSVRSRGSGHGKDCHASSPTLYGSSCSALVFIIMVDTIGVWLTSCEAFFFSFLFLSTWFPGLFYSWLEFGILGGMTPLERMPTP